MINSIKKCIVEKYGTDYEGINEMLEMQKYPSGIESYLGSIIKTTEDFPLMILKIFSLGVIVGKGEEGNEKSVNV